MSHTSKSQRTQIYLPKKLRSEIDAARALTGQSLADFLRGSAVLKIKQLEYKKTNAENLSDEIIGSMDVKNNPWEGLDLLEWQRELRQDRS